MRSITASALTADIRRRGDGPYRVVERDAFRITQGEEKIRNFDTKATAHRRFCGDCGCHVLYVTVPGPVSSSADLDRESQWGERIAGVHGLQDPARDS